MTRVDFYTVEGHDPESRWHLVARLAEKAFGVQQRVFIYSPDLTELESLDQMLWSWRADSFLPHALLPAGNAPSRPIAEAASVPVPKDSTADEPQDKPLDETILLGNQEPVVPGDVLINMADEVPPFFSRFARTLEVLNSDETIRVQGRRRYAFYRERGYPLRHHDLSVR